MIVLGVMTLTVFFLRYFVFSFYESPKFLLGRGKEAEAIAVLHKIAKYNKAPPPTLTIEQFHEIDEIMGTSPPTFAAKNVIGSFFASFKHLKGLFTNKLQLFIFILMTIAYMVGFQP